MVNLERDDTYDKDDGKDTITIPDRSIEITLKVLRTFRDIADDHGEIRMALDLDRAHDVLVGLIGRLR